MRSLLAALLVSLSMTGCATVGSQFSTNGPLVDAPMGFTVYCISHPARQECGGSGDEPE